jgi:hypothetical protein
MFRKLAEQLDKVTSGEKTSADRVFTFHPEQLSRWLDEVWAGGGWAAWGKIANNQPGQTPLGDGQVVSMSKLPDGLIQQLASGVNKPDPTNTTVQSFPLPFGYNPPALGTTGVFLWDHLIYAYLVESTGIIEILADVVRRYVTGESLPLPHIETTAWVRGTEDLFFRDPPLFRVGSLTSQLRPDARINRRNAYWRMFGLDLPHPTPGIDGQPWKLTAGAAANTRFLEIWNELLRQVWLGIENEKNTSGSKPTDSNYIAYLCQTIGQMLRLRRRGGMLSREEFSYVCMLNWFHLTVETDTSVVTDLSATAGTVGGNPADRLAAVGRIVGIEPSRQARELFELADLVSPLLWAIELQVFDDPIQAEMLFRLHDLGPTVTPIIAATLNRIIDLWQSATGERVKDLAVTQRRVQAPVRSAQPTKLLPGGLVPTAAAKARPAAPSANGQPVPAGR